MALKHKILRFESELLDVAVLNGSVRHFVFSAPVEFTFSPGQFVSALVPVGGLVKRTSYSIASAPSTLGSFDLCIKMIEGGPASTFFFSLKKGDKVHFMGPMGLFGTEHEDKEIAFISTGTGVAPFRSMAFHLLKNGFSKQLFMITGDRNEEGLYHNEMKALSEKHMNLEYHHTCSRPTPGYAGDVGHVQDLVAKYVPPDFGGDYYICGLPAMVNDVLKLLKTKGIGRERIFFEKY